MAIRSHAVQSGTTRGRNHGIAARAATCSAAGAIRRCIRDPWGPAPHQPLPSARRGACRAHATSWWPFPQGGSSATAPRPAVEKQQQQPTQKQQQGGRSVVQETTAAELRARVQQHCSSATATTKPLILMFTAEWCGPCSLVYKELTKLGALRPPGSFTALSLDVDASEENSKLATELGIYTLPTLIFVGKDENKPSISTTGHVSVTLVADVLDNKMSVCGGSLKNRLRM